MAGTAVTNGNHIQEEIKSKLNCEIFAIMRFRIVQFSWYYLKA
jgi:hypothetical protein